MGESFLGSIVVLFPCYRTHPPIMGYLRVIISSSAGFPDSLTLRARLIAGMTSSGSSTLSLYMPSPSAILAVLSIFEDVTALVGG